MVNSQDKEDINKKIDEVNIKKEEAFKIKEEQRKNISIKIKEIKEGNSLYNSNREELRKLIKQRDENNKKVKELIIKIKILQEKQKEQQNAQKVKFNHFNLKEQIDGLETKIETQGLDFDKEKKIMKQINELKKQYSQYSQVNKIFEEKREIQKQIDICRKEGDKLHKNVIDIQKKNKILHKDFIVKSKQIMQLRKDQDITYQKFLDLKKEYINLNNLINNKQQRYKKSNQSNKEKILHQKQQEIELKIKNKQKITNEDLLIFQSR